jgi:hypothetical protein
MAEELDDVEGREWVGRVVRRTTPAALLEPPFSLRGS